jgi:hypothetical protein
MQFLTAILATYRLAHLLPEDDGPFYIFKRVRFFVSSMAVSENDEWGFWQMVDDGTSCVYCCGLYAAILTAILARKKSKFGDLFLLIFAIAGGQSLLQRISDK